MTSTPLPRSGPDQRAAEGGRDPVVALGSTTPDWLTRWCRDSGRDLDLRPQPVTSAGAPPFAPGLAGPANELAGRTVWIPRDHREGKPSRVVAAIRELPGDAGVLAEAAAASAYLGATLVILHAVPVSFAERSVGLDAAVTAGQQLLRSAAASVAADPPDGSVPMSRLVRAHPYEIVGETLDADLLVIGGPRPPCDTSSGLVLQSALHHAPCSLLLAPRADGHG